MTLAAINRLYNRLRHAGLSKEDAWQIIEIAATMAVLGPVSVTLSSETR